MWNRFGPFAWWARVLGLPLPGDIGLPTSYRIGEVGPKGIPGTSGVAEGLRRERKGGSFFGPGEQGEGESKVVR